MCSCICVCSLTQIKQFISWPLCLSHARPLFSPFSLSLYPSPFSVCILQERKSSAHWCAEQVWAVCRAHSNPVQHWWALFPSIRHYHFTVFLNLSVSVPTEIWLCYQPKTHRISIKPHLNTFGYIIFTHRSLNLRYEGVTHKYCTWDLHEKFGYMSVVQVPIQVNMKHP